MIQERIEELNSAIINICDNNIKLTGFMSGDRLLDYYNNGLECRFSSGIYPKDDFDIAYIKDKALFLILENDIEVCRYEFAFSKKFEIAYKDAKDNNKNKTKTFTIRKCIHTSRYGYKDIDKSLIFDTSIDLKDFLQSEFNVDLEVLINMCFSSNITNDKIREYLFTLKHEMKINIELLPKMNVQAKKPPIH